jgi:hypothetical protein
MKQTVTKSMFRDEFKACGRGEQFSYEGLGHLFDYLEENDSEYDLDVIGLCCEYVESSYDDVRGDYNDCAELNDEKVLEYLNESTVVVWFDDEVVLYAHF